MNDDKFVPKAPDFRGDGIAIWLAEDKNGNDFLRVSVLGGKSVACFKVVPKEAKD